MVRYSTGDNAKCLISGSVEMAVNRWSTLPSVAQPNTLRDTRQVRTTYPSCLTNNNNNIVFLCLKPDECVSVPFPPCSHLLCASAEARQCCKVARQRREVIPRSLTSSPSEACSAIVLLQKAGSSFNSQLSKTNTKKKLLSRFPLN